MNRMKKTKKSTKKEWFDFNRAMVLLVIIILFALIRTIVAPTAKITKNNLAEEAEIVLGTLTDGSADVSLIKSNELMEDNVARLNQMGYDEVKNLLGVKNDFCIFFEDVTGSLVKVDNLDPAIGSNKIYINGQPCK